MLTTSNSNSILRVVVVGGGNASQALSAYLSHHHHHSKNGGLKTHTTIFAPFANEGKRINEASQGKIKIKYPDTHEPSVIEGNVDCVTEDPSLAFPDADVVMMPLPSFTYKPLLKMIIPHLKESCIIGATPGQGLFDFYVADALEECGREKGHLNVFSLLPLPFNCRITEFGKEVGVQTVKKNYEIAVAPAAKSTADVSDCNLAKEKVANIIQNLLLADSVRVIPSFLTASLIPLNMIIHPPRLFSLCGKVDSLPENPLFYEDMRLEDNKMMIDLDMEIAGLAKEMEKRSNGKLLIERPNIINFLARFVYHFEIDQPAPESTDDMTRSLHRFFTGHEAYKGFRCPLKTESPGEFVPDFSNRYFVEDIIYGLCTVKGFGTLMDYDMPVCDKIMEWCQKGMGKEYVVDGKFVGKDHTDSCCTQAFGVRTWEQLVEFYKE